MISDSPWRNRLPGTMIGRAPRSRSAPTSMNHRKHACGSEISRGHGWRRLRAMRTSPRSSPPNPTTEARPLRCASTGESVRGVRRPRAGALRTAPRQSAPPGSRLPARWPRSRCRNASRSSPVPTRRSARRQACTRCRRPRQVAGTAVGAPGFGVALFLRLGRGFVSGRIAGHKFTRTRELVGFVRTDRRRNLRWDTAAMVDPPRTHYAKARVATWPTR